MSTTGSNNQEPGIAWALRSMPVPCVSVEGILNTMRGEFGQDIHPHHDPMADIGCVMERGLLCSLRRLCRTHKDKRHM